jgi:hypothetical protein
VEFPSDVNGDVFRRMLAGADDLSRARPVDFEHILPTYEAAQAMASKAMDLGFTVNVEGRPDDRGSVREYDVRCTKTMVPTYESITEVEQRLGGIARMFGGYEDGWGCFQVDD